MKIIHVAVGAIVNKTGEVLIALRPLHVHQGGLWEFPGGKVEAGETIVKALVRELKEELNIDVLHSRPLIKIRHDYKDKSVVLDVWLVDSFSGEPEGQQGQSLQWVRIDDLQQYAFPEANKPIITALQLPDVCLITKEAVNKREFLQGLESALSRNIKLIQFRAHYLDDEEYISWARAALNLIRRFNARLLINRTPEVLSQVDADGLHLSSQRLLALETRPQINPNLWLSASCHNENELLKAQSCQVDFVFLSPVSPTNSHPNAVPIGWSRFRSLSEQTNMPVFALGGVGIRDLPQAFNHGAQGVAGISLL